MQTLETAIAQINAQVFLREFSFSQNTFRPKPSRPLELADHVIWWLGDDAIVFQLKDRSITAPATPAALDRWFDNKVCKEAKNQVRDTLRHINEHPRIVIKNQRGHALDFTAKRDQLKKLIVYGIRDEAPSRSRRRKYVESKEAGVIHVVALADYVGLCNTLITPAEIAEYLDFRENQIQKWPERVGTVSEKALVGQFLSGEELWPEMHYESFVDKLQNNSSAFVLTKFLDGVAARLTYPVDCRADPTEYYLILREFAQLNRAESQTIKDRLVWAMEKCRSDDVVRPSRVVVPRVDCSFAFIPMPKEFHNDILQGLKNITHAVKYDAKTTRVVGTAIVYDAPCFDMRHCLLDYPWQVDAEPEQFMRESPILRDSRGEQVVRYTFD